MKLFKTSNIRIVQELFHFELPSIQLARRRKVFSDKFSVCKCLLVKVVFVLILFFIIYHCIGE